MRVNLAFKGISTFSKIAFALATFVTTAFFVVQFLMFFDVLKHAHELDLFSCMCITFSVILYVAVVKDFLHHKKKIIRELEQKNTYLEHAAKIIRHDMHSGINTYIPRGIKSLERRLTPEQVKELNIEMPLKMIKEGLIHTQKVYHGVFEFTNLVKKDAVMNLTVCNIREILADYLSSTSYKSQVVLEESLDFTLKVNQPLFCTALDNLIRNGLKYNDSSTKIVKIYKEGRSIVVEDNGRGMSKEDFEKLSQPYVRKEGQKEQGTGLGLNICKSILSEHNFLMRVEKLGGGVGQFYKDLTEVEAKYKEKPKAYAFDRESLVKVAEGAKYKGKIRTKLGGRNRKKIYVFFDENKESNEGTKIKIKY